MAIPGLLETCRSRGILKKSAQHLCDTKAGRLCETLNIREGVKSRVPVKQAPFCSLFFIKQTPVRASWDKAGYDDSARGQDSCDFTQNGQRVSDKTERGDYQDRLENIIPEGERFSDSAYASYPPFPGELKGTEGRVQAERPGKTHGEPSRASAYFKQRQSAFRYERFKTLKLALIKRLKRSRRISP